MFIWQREVRPGWTVAFTDAEAGSLSMAVPGDGLASRARQRLRWETGVAQPFRFMQQMHGSGVAAPKPGVEGAEPLADALVSDRLPLAVLVADCVPVVFLGDRSGADFVSRPVGAVAHAGRRGLAEGVLPATVAALRQRGAEEIEAWIGPAICGSCYEVPPELREEVSAIVPETFADTSWGTPALDLPGGVSAQLNSLGVRSHDLRICTFEEPRLFSHRRTRREQAEQVGGWANHAAEGRFAGLIWSYA